MIALVLTAAFGQSSPDASGQLFRPSIDSEKTLWTDDAGKAPSGYMLARGMLHYANRPVVYVGDDGETTPVVSDLLQLSVLAAYSRGPIRLGLDVPIYLRSEGLEGGETGLGDLGVDLKVTALDREQFPLGLALAGRVILPTSTVDAALGNGGLGYEVQAIVDRAFGDLLVAANVGTRGVPKAEFENLTWDDQLVARLGLGYGNPDKAGVSLDVGTHMTYANLVPGSTPAEAIAGGWVRPARDVVLRGGLGTGITTGFGAPRFRALLGIAWEPSRARDGDGDGILDRADACPTDPEDMDGYLDTDGCPEPTRVVVVLQDSSGQPVQGTWSMKGLETVSGGTGSDDVVAAEGEYTLTATAEGFVDATLKVTVPGGEQHRVIVSMEPLVVPGRLTVSVLDLEGKPIVGATWGVRGNGNPTGKAPGDEVELLAGEYTVRAEAPGYRPVTLQAMLVEGKPTALDMKLAPAKVEVKADRIDIKESVFFETGKAIIKPESFGLLDEVAQILNDHPEISKVRIEGHTDSRGAASTNLKLSVDRAASVRTYLVSHGVSESRLQSEGFGEGKPLDPANNEAAWAKNRRVDFFVAERVD